MPDKKAPPSVDKWLSEARADLAASKMGMFLLHNGIVRQTPRALARQGIDDGTQVRGMLFSYDAAKVDKAIAETYKMDGIYYVKAWLNEGRLAVGEDIMYVLVGGDIRTHVLAALQFLVEKLKTECVTEIELKE